MSLQRRIRSWVGQRRNVLWFALVSLVLSMLVTLVWLAGRYEVEKLQLQTDRDASDAVSDLRNGLNRNLRALETIIPFGMTPTKWASQAELLLRDRREWLRLEWRDTRLGLVAAANSPSRSPLLAPWGPDHMMAEINLACTQAKRWSNATYSPSTFFAAHNNVGVEVVQMCLPWSMDGELSGYLIASYSLADTLTSLVS